MSFTFKTLKTTVTIENVPAYATKLPYIVARVDDQTSKFWFYGAWEDKSEAERVSEELGESAFVFENELFIKEDK